MKRRGYIIKKFIIKLYLYTIIAALIAIGLIFSLFKTFDTRLLEEIGKNLTIETNTIKLVLAHN